jgi:hypothetical protein
MRKLHGFVSLLFPVLFVGLMWTQEQPKPVPSPLPTPQTSQPAPDALAAIAQIEKLSEAQSIEKTKQSALKIRNALGFQTPFDAIKSDTSYKQFEWPGFYEFRNPSDKPIVITDFRVTTGLNLFEEKLVRVTTRSKPDRIEAFGSLDGINTAQDLTTVKTAIVKLPITIPQHTVQFLKIHLVFDVTAPHQTLEFQNENEANKWFSAAIGLRQDEDGHFRCGFAGFPIEVSTADNKTLQYEPFTTLIVPGCRMRIPRRPQ